LTKSPQTYNTFVASFGGHAGVATFIVLCATGRTGNQSRAPGKTLRFIGPELGGQFRSGTRHQLHVKAAYLIVAVLPTLNVCAASIRWPNGILDQEKCLSNKIMTKLGLLRGLQSSKQKF